MLRRLIIAGLLGLSGCATQYGDMGFTGGVSAQRIDETTVSIEARGNAWTHGMTIVNYVLRKAAEETVTDGYEVFTVVATVDQSRQVEIDDPAQTHSETTFTPNGFGGATARTTSFTTPGGSSTLTKPGLMAQIQMSHGPCPQQKIAKVYCASDVLKYMVPAR